MLRFLTFATLLLVAVCLALGASIALAADQPPQDTRAIEAIDPDRRMIDDSLAAIDLFEFECAAAADHRTAAALSWNAGTAGKPAAAG